MLVKVHFRCLCRIRCQFLHDHRRYSGDIFAFDKSWQHVTSFAYAKLHDTNLRSFRTWDEFRTKSGVSTPYGEFVIHDRAEGGRMRLAGF